MRPKLLLVDDEPSIRESLRKLLQAEQYEVVLAVNGIEAVDVFRGDPTCFDLVLTDLNMPLRNGWASIDRLLEFEPLVPIILFTGIPNQRDLAESSRVSALVEKPIDVPAFLTLIRSLLSGLERSPLSENAFPQPRFQYLPSCQNPSINRQGDPYAHWGLNE